jgi:uncharacterized protein YcbX
VTLTGIFTHPIKSCAPVSHAAVRLDVLGLPWDRHWVIAHDGKFLSQRDVPELALVGAEVGNDALTARHPHLPPLVIPLRPANPRIETSVIVWKDTVTAWDEGDEAATWLSRIVGNSVRLLRISDSARRPVNPKYATRPATTAFSDGFPILIATGASLDELNRRLRSKGAAPVPMNRFRPNLVVSGTEPFAEDRWRTIRIGDALIDIVKPCSRCIVTSIDQTTAHRAEPTEPLATLALFRRTPGGVMFAQNAIHHAPARLELGGRVEVISEGPATV